MLIMNCNWTLNYTWIRKRGEKYLMTCIHLIAMNEEELSWKRLNDKCKTFINHVTNKTKL